MIFSKRIYEKSLKGDGIRILVDRMWPRGITKRQAKNRLLDERICALY